ncbi:Dilute domain-containing protein C25B8.08 [Golovinomyces cichoracearum]|uniref:Dilute domain-containing protein C25B8.08 n=1 Tax=Golovinomyces cichoracearum TaxID=62708 RepID=A0A420ID70_9PEZI|nr:Dilute domain-containing protein C25B8.08 [Golovinomyces cichoracearum]
MEREGFGGGLNIDMGDEGAQRSNVLPDDLPKSLDDRKNVPSYLVETEIYDAWQVKLGQSQIITPAVPVKPLQYRSLSIDYGSKVPILKLSNNDNRLIDMVAAQAAHRDISVIEDEDVLANNDQLSEDTKKEILQKSLNMAASNGDIDRTQRILKGNARRYIDLDAPDEEGTTPLIYASCFGHERVVIALLDAGAKADCQDQNQWSALMWAMTNRHKSIAKVLLDHGASTEIKSASGRTALDFIAPDSDLTEYLQEHGYKIGNLGVPDDFYIPGLSQDRFEEEMAENEMRRRMMMESARDLEVDIGNMGFDDQPETPDESGEIQGFDWNRCLHDQMFVFQESELDRILNIVITTMTPQRSTSQKPVPANILFLSARYAHYHANPDLLARLISTALGRINDVVESHQWDMTILAFWISNVTLLLHYLKKDGGLSTSTSKFQYQLAELINAIFILIIRDAERRIDKTLDSSMLDHETIKGFEDIAFQNEWKIFRRKQQVKEEPAEKRFRPPSPKARSKPSPRNVTSLLSSTLFVLNLYDIHSVITSQILSQLFYWLGAELFNRIMSNRKYLARSKAMQIRMNLSMIEEWSRSNNLMPEHYEDGSMTSTGESTIDAARYHLAPVIQLLQWLQCFSSLEPNNLEALSGTVQQLTRLTPQHLVHAVKHYRAEVGENSLPKSGMKYLVNLQKEWRDRKSKSKNIRRNSSVGHTKTSRIGDFRRPSQDSEKAHNDRTSSIEEGEEYAPEGLFLDPAHMLPFTLPSNTDMLVSYGAGFGGVNHERECKYIPTVSAEFLAKLDANGERMRSKYTENFYESEEV